MRHELDHIDEEILCQLAANARISNTNVKAVQFVIQTEGIHAEKAEEVVAEPEENLSFWQKLLALFGL